MTNKDNPEIFACYLPVLHDGYIQAFDRHTDATIGIFDETINEIAPYLRKDIRALKPKLAQAALRGLGRESSIISLNQLPNLLSEPTVMPDDDVSRRIEELYPDAIIIKEPVFLRWDRDNSIEAHDIHPDRTVKLDQNDPIISVINHEMSKSTNWWRHVGALLVKDGALTISSHNSSLPTEYSSWIDGDPRITAKKGESIERSIDIHAEARLIVEASRSGVSLEGSSICVSTFPCPNCAKLISLSGINTCYYVDGYAMLDGYDVMKQAGIEIVKIDTDLEQDTKYSTKPYPTS